MKHFLPLLIAAMACQLAAAQSATDAHDYEIYQQLSIFNNLYRTLDLEYVDSLKATKVVGNAIESMLGQLDPYTEYFPEENTDELRQLTTGKYAGIGSIIAIDRKQHRCYIADPYRGMPADKAGLRFGDVIMAQDGTDYGLATEGKEQEYSTRVSQSLRGEPGTAFDLTVMRPGQQEPITVHITRQLIQLPTVTYSGMVADTVGYIFINNYAENTTREVEAAILSLKQQGARALILDLRGNPGGLLEQAVRVTGLFIPKGKEVVRLKGKRLDYESVYKTTEEPIELKMPICVMVSGSTASAAEITSGALQDYDRAVIVGQRTYGKGLVQSPRPLPSGGVLKMTTAKYYIPSGRCIQAYTYANGEPRHLPDSIAKAFKTAGGRTVYDGGGIKPDIEIEPDSLPTLLSYLSVSDVLTEYLVHFRSTHESIASPQTFALSDAEYEELKDFLRTHGFTYDNQSKSALSVLRRIATAEGYAEAAAKELDELEKKLSPGFDYDFDHWKEEVCKYVGARIVEMYYYNEGMVIFSLRTDKELQTALKQLR